MEQLSNNIFELQYAMDTFYFLVCGALVMWMAVALYILTKSINKNRATLGFIFRVAEVVMGFVMLLLYAAIIPALFVSI